MSGKGGAPIDSGEGGRGGAKTYSAISGANDLSHSKFKTRSVGSKSILSVCSVFRVGV